MYLDDAKYFVNGVYEDENRVTVTYVHIRTVPERGAFTEQETLKSSGSVRTPIDFNIIFPLPVPWWPNEIGTKIYSYPTG